MVIYKFHMWTYTIQTIVHVGIYEIWIPYICICATSLYQDYWVSYMDICKSFVCVHICNKKDLEIFFSKSLSWREDTYLWFDRLEKINPYINLWVPHRRCSQCVPSVSISSVYRRLVIPPSIPVVACCGKNKLPFNTINTGQLLHFVYYKYKAWCGLNHGAKRWYNIPPIILFMDRMVATHLSSGFPPLCRF